MTNNAIDRIREIVCDLQKQLIAVEDHSKNLCENIDALHRDYALKIIDILDMLDILHENSLLDHNAVIKKIEKRLRNILTAHDVSEITFLNNQVEVGKARVVETRELSSDTTPGIILEICRKGYQRNDKVLRPADVITAHTNSNSAASV